MFSNIHWYYLH